MWRIKTLDDILLHAERKSLHRSLGAFQLMMLGVGAIIGTGIFVLTSVGAERAGPGLMLSFVIAGTVCAFAALAYAEFAAMVPVAGSAYTYSYAVMGELTAWLVGWNLILEYAVSSAAVAVGWSGYMNGFLDSVNIHLPVFLQYGAFDWHHPGGGVNVLAMSAVLAVTGLLVVGTRESAIFNSILVTVKLLALGAFIFLALPELNMENFSPFAPYGYGSSEIDGISRGVMAAAALIFFAYVGFDAVSTAAEETKNPNRNVPLGLIGSLAICTVIYLLVAAGALGTTPYTQLVGNSEPLAFVLRNMGHTTVGNLVALAAIFALPTVVMMMMYGQSRVFFVMARDGLLPKVFSSVHPRFRTPHVITLVTGVIVALISGLFSVDEIAELSNSGTLFAFIAVAIGVMVLRVKQPNRPRPFKCPAVYAVGTLAVLGCLGLMISLPTVALVRFGLWTLVGVIVYALYGYRASPMHKRHHN